MCSLTQLLLGMATAGVVAGPQRPLALVAGAVAGLLPDLLDGWAGQLYRQPDITVTPDPLDPQLAPMAAGLRLAIQQTRATGRPCILRCNPLPDRRGGFIPYQLDYDRQHRLLFARPTGGKSARVHLTAPGSAPDEPFEPLHPLPLPITNRPVDLELHTRGPRMECRDLAQVAGVGHAWPVAGGIAIATSLCAPWLGAAVAATLAMHLLLDAAGRRESRPGFPFTRQTCYGRRLWHEAGWRANAAASAIAAGALAVLLLSSR
jgi:hypothetical protein